MSRLRVRGGSCLTGEMQWRKAKAPDRCDNLPSGWPSYGGIFDLDAKRDTLKQLDERMAAPEFWNDQQKAQAVLQQVKALRAWIEPFDDIAGRLTNAQELDEMLASEPDAELAAEVQREVAALGPAIESFRLKSFLSGPD